MNSVHRRGSPELWSWSCLLPSVERLRHRSQWWTGEGHTSFSSWDSVYLGFFILSWGDSIHVHLLCSKSMRVSPVPKYHNENTHSCFMQSLKIQLVLTQPYTTCLCTTYPTMKREELVGRDCLEIHQGTSWFPLPTCSSLWTSALHWVSLLLLSLLLLWNIVLYIYVYFIHSSYYFYYYTYI